MLKAGLSVAAIPYIDSATALMRILITISALNKAQKLIILLGSLVFASALLPVAEAQVGSVQKSAQGLPKKSDGTVKRPKSAMTSVANSHDCHSKAARA